MLPANASQIACRWITVPVRLHRRTRRGFDPNRWFANVEIGMYRAVSGEPASYVRKVYKYYVTYQGLEKSRQARQKALEDLPG